MSTFDLNSAMAQINQLHTQQEENAKFVDPRFVYTKAGHNYSFRLLWVPSKERQLPIIFKLTHEYGIGSDRDIVTCPTSDYELGKAGFQECAICEEATRLYNDFKDNKNQTSKDLYNKFKRQYRNTALVYVVADDCTPANVGKVMLFRMPKGISDQIKREVFGWVLKKGEVAIPADQLIGGKAFDKTSGFNLNISVTSKVTDEGTFNSYSASFSRNESPIPLTDKQALDSSIELKFDEEFYVKWDKTKTDEFASKHILQSAMDSELGGTTTPAQTTPSTTPDTSGSFVTDDKTNPDLEPITGKTPENDTDAEIKKLLAGIGEPTV